MDANTMTMTVAEAVAAFRGQKETYKRTEAAVTGAVRLVPTDKAKGLNVRKIDTSDAAALAKVFDTIASKDISRKALQKSFYDEKRDALVATDGRKMLYCRIPEGVTKEAAAAAGFETDPLAYPNWGMVTDKRDTTPYALADLIPLVEFTRKNEKYNMLVAMDACNRAYHNDEHEMWFSIDDEVLMNTTYVREIVDALLRLGNERVVMYAKSDIGGHRNFTAPLHFVGFGAGLDSMAVLMPLRAWGVPRSYNIRMLGTENIGYFVMDSDGKAAVNAA